MRSRKIELVFGTIIASIVTSSISWMIVVVKYFKLQKPYLKIIFFEYFPKAFSSFPLILITIGCIIGSTLLCSLVAFIYSKELSDPSRFKEYLRGAKLITKEKLSRKTKERNASQITIADIPIPSKLENLHFLIGGRTGTGKTVAIKEMLSKIIPRGDRVILTDPNGDFLSHFYKKGDTLLNPFDSRSELWSIFNELDVSYDHQRFARSIIPPSTSTQDAEWHGYAQLLFAETTKKLFEENKRTTKDLVDWLTMKPSEDLAKLLHGTAATGLFDPGASRALASVRFIITKHVDPHQHLKPGSFSLRRWLQDEKGGNLYITWREDMAASLRPLISTWVDVLCTSILSLPESSTRRIWIIIDELASLERLSSLEDALTKGRKHGLRVVAGLQTTAQLDKLYGRNQAIGLRSCFSNLLILGGTASDPQTAEDFSRGLGEREVELQRNSKTRTLRGTQQTQSDQHLKERLILPSEIVELPPLEGFLSLAGNYPVARVKLKPKDLPLRTHPFRE